MYETLMNTLRTFLGSAVLQTALLASFVIIILAFAANLSPAFRGVLARMRERGGWRGTLADLGGGILKFLILFVITRLFITAMSFQSVIFAQQHGRITDRNRSAVLMKWGCPHEQRELTVSQTRKRVWVTRQLEVEEKDKDAKVLSESFWKDEEPPVQAVGGKLPTVLSVREEERDVAVEQKSIVGADVDIGLKNNPRTLGNANYAGYDDTWKMKYTVANQSRWATTARMTFPLPAETGFFDEMYLRVNGTNMLDATKSVESALAWQVDMAPQSQCTVEIGYRSRGLEHLRYIPRRMTQTGHYRVAMAVDGIAAEKLDYPIGSMPPSESLATLKGAAYTLTWKLDNALTSYDIGIKLPQAEQPNYHFANLLNEAPVGLILLFILLTVPRIIAGQAVRMELVALLGVAYYLHYTLMGRLADHMTGFAGPFAVSAAAMTILVGWLRWRDRDSAFLRLQDVVAFAALAILYPLAIVDTDWTGLWMQVFYLAALIYGAGVLIRFRILTPQTPR